MFPGRGEIPKTIIFAQNDSHADDIIQITREEFGIGNEFCRKITYRVDRADSVLADFRNSYDPRIAVTVDMIATGTDVKPVECLLFMRDVRSRSYFEQMKGRGTRTLGRDDLRKVTPSATSNKTHFVIVDAVGVTRSLKTDSRPLERKPGVPLKDLLMSIAMGSRDEDVFVSLANRLTRLDKELSPAEQKQYAEHAGGEAIRETAQRLLDAFNSDKIEEETREKYQLSDEDDISEEQLQTIQKAMAEEAAQPFYLPKLRTFIEDARKAHDQIIDTVNIDKVNTAMWDGQHNENARKTIIVFEEFINTHKNDIIALSIIYNQSWKNRPLTLDMIQDLYAALNKPPYNLTTEILWRSYATSFPDKVKAKSPERMLSDIVSILRFELGIDTELKPFADMVDTNFRDWTFSKNAGRIHFTEEQMNWLRMIKDFIAASLSITADDLNLSPFDGSGGLGKFYELFGNGYKKLLAEMNLALTA
jgi:type I restriction enzyme R subunit